MQFHYVHLSCFLFFIFACSANAMAQEDDGAGLHPRITYISQSQTKDAGGTAYFSCHVVNPGPNTVTWLKGKSGPGQALATVVATGDEVVVTPDEEDRINVRNVGNYHTLQVKNVRAEDAGVYYCELTHNVGATTELFVRSLPVFTGGDSDPVVLDEGNSGNLTCSAIGYPTPDIYWSRDKNFTQNSVIATGNVYQILLAEKNTRGRYYCLAQNTLGAVRRSIDVEVTFGPRLNIERPIFGATLGQDTTLECLTNGYPAPTIKWLKRDVVLENDDHYGISQTRTGEDYFTNATLYIKSIQLEHFGVYICKAENGIGSTEGRIAVLQNVFQEYRGSISSDGKSKTFQVPEGSNSTPTAQVDTTSVSSSTTPVPTVESYDKDESFVLETTTRDFEAV